MINTAKYYTIFVHFWLVGDINTWKFSFSPMQQRRPIVKVFCARIHQFFLNYETESSQINLPCDSICNISESKILENRKMVSDSNDDIAASVLKSSEKTLRYMRRKIEFLSSGVICFRCKIISNRILVKGCNAYWLFYRVFQSSSVMQNHEFQSLSVIRKKCISVKKLRP